MKTKLASYSSVFRSTDWKQQYSSTEIPGPTIKNTSPANKREDYKYSTPIEGPDNQFGSADSPDDEDERETTYTTDRHPNAYKHENVTKNRTINYSPTPEQKLSNKVRKIINKFEIEEFGANRCCVQTVFAINCILLLGIIVALDYT